MAYDEGLAERLREALQLNRGVTEKKMFGGLAFMSRGYMFIGIVGDVLMARVGPEHYEQALSRPHARVMDFTGKPMKGYVFVDPAGFESDSDLSDWAQWCHGYVQSLPPKKSK
jgi:TfoX/Sxy family transcriptional regulator of competence genes